MRCGIVETLELVQKRQQLALRSMSPGTAIARCSFGEDLLSKCEVRVEVHLSGLDRLVSEP